MGDVAREGGEVVGMGRRALGSLLPRSFLDAVAVLGLRFDPLTDPVSFSFHRRRRDGMWGWAIHLHVGKLIVCAPWIDGLPFPRRRADAERWVIEFCGRIRIDPMRNVDDESIRKRIRASGIADRRSALRLIKGGA